MFIQTASGHNLTHITAIRQNKLVPGTKISIKYLVLICKQVKKNKLRVVFRAYFKNLRFFALFCFISLQPLLWLYSTRIRDTSGAA
jgi:hypothetical protein